ncbi:transcriptional regulator domain-containing protein [Mesorhizobium sp. RIZ17]|uniref:transcriptional regulator domain-containing protein n=1 Tax=Mesorhizobium sp. RIZ17 TaxID=3132743 RepID=UPI003DA9A086
MKPNTSRWRDNDSYDFFDDLPIEGLAWECLRRSDTYQQHYLALVRAGCERDPFPTGAQSQWGLRFRGPTRFVRPGTRRPLVASRRSCGACACTVAGFPLL